MKIIPCFYSLKKAYKNKNVQIGLFDEAHAKEAKELFYAQDVIGNYLSSKHLKVKFDDAGLFMGYPSCKGDLYIHVDSTKKHAGGKGRIKIIKYDDGSEKPFLRRVYETVQSLAGHPESPIKKLTAETYSKLVKSGKISV